MKNQIVGAALWIILSVSIILVPFGKTLANDARMSTITAECKIKIPRTKKYMQLLIEDNKCKRINFYSSVTNGENIPTWKWD